MTQTNVVAAAAATLSPSVGSTVELPSLPSLSSAIPPISIPALPALELPLPADALPSFVFGPARSTVVLPGITIGPPPATSTAPRLVVPSVSLGDFEVGDGDELGATGLGLEIDTVVEVLLGSVLPAPSEPVARGVDEAHADAPQPAAPPRRRLDAARAPDASAVASSATPAAPTPRVAVAPAVAAQSEAARVKRPAPSWKRNDGAPRSRAPVPSPSSTSASAAGAGGSSGGGLPVFLALPFLVALLDLARRVALDRVTWPSGHRRRMPDTPG